MYSVKNFFDNDDVKVINEMGPFKVVEYQRDLSVTPSSAALAYYCNEMNVRKRQVVCQVGPANITLQAGAMQWTVGGVNATTGVKGVGDLFSKALRGSVTGESAIKPEYTGKDKYSVAVFRRLYDFEGEELRMVRDYALNFKAQINAINQQRILAAQTQGDDILEVEDGEGLPLGKDLPMGGELPFVLNGDKDALPD